MGAVGRYVADTSWSGSQALSASSYATVEATGAPTKAAKIAGVYLYFSGCTATSVTVAISRDADGDNLILPPTTADVDAGLTTTAKGSAVIAMNLDYYGARLSDTSGSLYVHVKLADGAATLAEAHVLVQE